MESAAGNLAKRGRLASLSSNAHGKSASENMKSIPGRITTQLSPRFAFLKLDQIDRHFSALGE
jgi:hypothetical protein